MMILTRNNLRNTMRLIDEITECPGVSDSERGYENESIH
jgi:hypothetical protein